MGIKAAKLFWKFEIISEEKKKKIMNLKLSIFQDFLCCDLAIWERTNHFIPLCFHFSIS